MDGLLDSFFSKRLSLRVMIIQRAIMQTQGCKKVDTFIHFSPNFNLELFFTFEFSPSNASPLLLLIMLCLEYSTTSILTTFPCSLFKYSISSRGLCFLPIVLIVLACLLHKVWKSYLIIFQFLQKYRKSSNKGRGFYFRYDVFLGKSDFLINSGVILG